MELKEMTPAQRARRTYEEKNKAKRKQASGQFGTYLPKDLFNEINAFLVDNKITKVRLIKEGYKALRDKIENGTVDTDLP